MEALAGLRRKRNFQRKVTLSFSRRRGFLCGLAQTHGKETAQVHTICDAIILRIPSRRMDTCCELRQKLAVQFAVHARLYAEAVVNLTQIGGMTHEQYYRLREAAQKAQVRAEKASAAFEEHVEWHRCNANGYGIQIAQSL